MIKLTGTQNARLGDNLEEYGDRKWQMTIKDDKIILWDYNYRGEKQVYNIPIHDDGIGFVERPDNSGQVYRQIELSGEYIRWYDYGTDKSRFIECHIQTWNGTEFFIWAIWPHSNYAYRGAEKNFNAESVIVKFGEKSKQLFEDIWAEGTKDKNRNKYGEYH